MKLRELTYDDVAFYEEVHCDPRMMTELGGPLPPGQERKVRDIVDGVRDGTNWYFVIVPGDDPSVGAGTVCIWEGSHDGQPINEIGWMVLPRFQGRGLGKAAVLAVLDRARAESRWDVVHAFPGVTNAASNALCRAAGFTQLEECDIEYVGRTLRCNHWRIDLRAVEPREP